MTKEDEREVRRRYSNLKFTNDQNNAIYDCYMKGVNYDGHTWVTWTDVERLLCNLFEVEE